MGKHSQDKSGEGIHFLPILSVAFALSLAVFSVIAGLWSNIWLGNILANFQPHLAVLGFVLLIGCLFLGLRIPAVVGAAVCLANGALIVGQLPAQGTLPTDARADRLRLMTFNVLHSNQDVGALRESLIEVQPDVVLLQEVSRRWNRHLHVLADLYPHRTPLAAIGPKHDDHGNVVLSRLPLLDVRQPTLAGMTGRLTAARISLRGKSIWVASVHIDKPDPLGRPNMQRRQLAELQDWITGMDPPLTLGGDFNATLHTPQLNVFITRTGVNVDLASDPWWSIARGTYPAWVPLFGLKIDHIMALDIAILDSAAIRISGSDHRAVVTNLRL